MTLSFFGLWSNRNYHPAKAPDRSIASTFNSTAESFQTAQLIKSKNKIWNKIFSPHDFENFNDQEYFRWIEIYKDSNEQLSTLNPVIIEKRMALIEVINKRLVHTPLLSHKNQSVEGLRLSSYKLDKLQNHMDNFDINKPPSRNDIHNFAADLMIILKNPPAALMDYFMSNKTPKMSASLMKMLQEDILLMGLKGIIERIPNKSHDTDLKQAKLTVKKFFQHKIWMSSIMPYDLPWLEKVNIPEALLENIMINGLESHDKELIAYFQKQNMIDHYERFRKVYKPIVLSAAIYFYFEKFKTEEESIKKINYLKNLSPFILH